MGIFLTGYMGAGKTTLGKAFAREMNVPFIDLDWYIEERFHKSIREMCIRDRMRFVYSMKVKSWNVVSTRNFSRRTAIIRD